MDLVLYALVIHFQYFKYFVFAGPVPGTRKRTRADQEMGRSTGMMKHRAKP